MDISIERILQLMQVNNISATQLHNTCDLTNSSMTRWKNGRQKPSAETLVKIADFFNVTTDYLLGRTDSPHPIDHTPKNNIPPKTLLNWDLLAPNEVEVVDNLIQILAKKHKE